MQKKNGNYEKIILLIAALIALGTAGYLIFEGQRFGERLVMQAARTNNDPGRPPVENPLQAIERLKQKITWTSPVILNKPVPLNRSVLLVLKDGTLYDLFVKEPVFREPMTNEFLVKHDIPELLSPNVGDLDADGDGFSNKEEFLKNTNPRDPKDRPPVTDKLFLKQRITHDYILRLNSSATPFQVQRVKPEPKVSKFVNVGEEFGFEKNVVRFKVESFEKKVVPDDRLGEKDVSELTVTDLATKKKVLLVKGVDNNLAEFEAEFEFRLGTPPPPPRIIKKGDKFQIPGFGQTYIVQEVEEDKAVIVPLNNDGSLGTPLTIPRG